jgi:protein gp37
LRKVPATIRFVSVEPMPGPIQAELDGTNWCICGGETIKPGQKNDDGSRSVSND